MSDQIPNLLSVRGDDRIGKPADPANPATTTADLRERAGKKTTGNKTRDSGHMSGWYFTKKREEEKQATKVTPAKQKNWLSRE